MKKLLNYFKGREVLSGYSMQITHDGDSDSKVADLITQKINGVFFFEGENIDDLRLEEIKISKDGYFSKLYSLRKKGDYFGDILEVEIKQKIKDDIYVCAGDEELFLNEESNIVIENTDKKEKDGINVVNMLVTRK